jgi:hypothetical protein
MIVPREIIGTSNLKHNIAVFDRVSIFVEDPGDRVDECQSVYVGIRCPDVQIAGQRPEQSHFPKSRPGEPERPTELDDCIPG